MRRVIFAIPGDLSTATGGYAYARRLLREGPGFGVDLVPLPLAAAFPAPSPSDIVQAIGSMNEAAPADGLLLIDGLACGALPLAALESLRAPYVVLHHHPLYLETGLSPQCAKNLFASERAALSRARNVIATSTHSGRVLRTAFGLPADRLTVAPPAASAPCCGSTASPGDLRGHIAHPPPGRGTLHRRRWRL